MPTARHQTKTKSPDSSFCVVYCDLQFEFYPRLNLSPNSLIGEHSGTSLGFLFLIWIRLSSPQAWNFRLALLDLIYPTGLVRVRPLFVFYLALLHEYFYRPLKPLSFGYLRSDKQPIYPGQKHSCVCRISLKRLQPP